MELEWDESYSIGIEVVDNQHKKLFSILNDFSASMMRGSAKYTIQGILARLADYTHYHFQSEEELMVKYDYPAYDEHKKAHDEFKRDLAELIIRFRDGEVMVNIDTYTTMRDWILEHVTDHNNAYDQALGKYLIDHPDTFEEYLFQGQDPEAG